MRQFTTVLFIMIGILLYGGLFLEDGEAKRRADEIENQHRIVPQPHANEVVLVAEATTKDEIELTFTAGSGEAFKAYIDRKKASVFLESTLAYIEERRTITRERTARRIDEVFSRVFDDRDQAVNAYADWFYGFFTSFELIGRGTWSALGEMFSADIEKIKQAPLQAVEDEMRSKYMEMVLKPHLRDPAIVKGVEDVLADAHRDYRGMLENIDDRVVSFIGENARYVERIDPKDALQIKLDWVAESWRAPMLRADDALVAGAAGTALALGGALGGEALLSGFSTMFATILGEATIGAEAVAGGAVLGSAEPIVGTAIGALAGLTVHGILNLFREKLERESFIKDTQAGLDVSLERWQGLIRPKAILYVDRWFQETQKLVATPNLEAKLGS